jgi:long-chain acyl-CoA synthetase
VTKKVREAFGGSPVFISGGAALDPEVAATLMDLGLNVYQGYGITEVEVKIHDANSEGVGEIWAKGPNIMLGYYNNPQATKEAITDGWYHTGDLGCLEDDGYLRICGRLKNLIVTANGKNVYPELLQK